MTSPRSDRAADVAVAGPPDRAPDWVGIDHVQLAIPVGGEDVARSFYVDVLGLVEVPKPAVMAARGGAWFECGAVRVHVGAEADFVPAHKAHPALTVRALREFIDRAGLDATWNDEIAGLVRCHVADPFGNRIELVEADTIESPTVRSQRPNVRPSAAT